MNNLDYVKWFRDTSPYIQSHQGKTFVLMLPGAAIADDNFINIIGDINLLSSLGIRLVLVYGARPQIEARFAAAGIDSHLHKGKRVTDAQSMNLVCESVGALRNQIEAAFFSRHLNAPKEVQAAPLISGNFVTAMPYGVIDGVDLQHTGKVRRVASQSIAGLLDQKQLVLLPPLGYSPTGETFNLSYAELATRVAIDLKADKLIAFCSEDGAYNAKGKLYRELTLLECQATLGSDGDLSDHRLALEACYKACEQGVARAHMLNYSDDGALLKELFSRDGAGTMVHRDSYELIRRARISDVGGILDLIQPLERQGILVRRSRERLEMEVEHFTVMEKDGAIIACAALYPFNSANSGELACVVTAAEYQGGGRAAKLLKHIERQAKKLGFEQLFTLTTQTAHWFIEQGFELANVAILPDEKQSFYNYQRNSKVFVKKIAN
ncbi:MAG: amino-acid N-acetyltransferase [Cellvibrionaceae bacterium]|nr:amino-acid N-acetyltransferase [Cellvibrionaceae bacterium]MCV6627158.1 amino-acid N-acetyltransferase [Cellvibrionaceae bacterium]